METCYTPFYKNEVSTLIFKQKVEKNPDFLRKCNKRLKKRHWELGRHFEKHIDCRWYPDYKLEPISLFFFIQLESEGKKSLTEDEMGLILPLLDGKINKELTRYMRFEEIAEWWSKGWGWYNPVSSDIGFLFKERSKDKIDLLDLINTVRKIRKEGMWSFIEGFTGFSEEQRQRFYERKIGSLNDLEKSLNKI